MTDTLTTIIAMTGASGGPVALDFIQRCPGRKYVIASSWGQWVLEDETGQTLEDITQSESITVIKDTDLHAPVCSGGMAVDAMVVLPCSSNTLGKIAGGIGDSVITRAAHVTLKEKRKLILCLREAPLSGVDLENCQRLDRAGAVIMPLSPMWYFKPATLDDLIGAFTERLIAMCGGPRGRVWPEGRHD